VLACAVVVLLVWLVVGRGFLGPTSDKLPARGRSASIEVSPPLAAGQESVILTIDFGNGARLHYDALPWHAEMTVGEVMDLAARFRPGIAYLSIGEGPGALLTSLGGVANEGAGGRNWLYQVGDRRGDVSFAVCPLSPGDRVLWSFEVGE
jgi:hypothetical protein